MLSKAPHTLAGTVEEYDDRAGYGYIVPDHDAGISGKLLVHRGTLRHRDVALTSGMRVAFVAEPYDRGIKALDVRPEDEGNSSSDLALGTLARFKAEREFGFIRLDDGRDAFFHVSRLVDRSKQVSIGDRLSCRLVVTDRGLQAHVVDIVQVDSQPEIAPVPDSDQWLARALVARDKKQLDEAALIYREGLRHAPSLQMLLSYAAMEKSRSRPMAAMQVYEEGMRLFPRYAKLYEDAGVLASSILQYDRALLLLDRALTLCRSMHQGGEKGTLLALARTHNAMAGTHSSSKALQKTISLYEEAIELFGKGATQLPQGDLLALEVARVRVQHHRGALTYAFLRGLGFEIVRALPATGGQRWAELVVRNDDPELQEGYGIARHLVVFCMLTGEVTLGDLEAIDQAVVEWSDSGMGDEHTALLVVASLPDDLQRMLWNRTLDQGSRRQDRAQPAIVPIQQADIETGADPRQTLNSVLDRWLYRRDLFKGSNAVFGRRFFGREKPLAQLRDAVTSGTPVAVFALRKVGKTSLLKEARRRFSEQGDIVAFLDLQSTPADIADARWLYWKVAAELKQACEHSPMLRSFPWRSFGGVEDGHLDYLAVPQSFPLTIAFDSDISKLLRGKATQQLSYQPRIVLLLDEIEHLLPSPQGRPGFVGFFEFLAYLRGVCQQNQHFLVVATAANPSVSERAQFDSRDNPVFNFFEEIYLQFLEPAECATMIRTLGRGMGLRFADGAADLIYSLTGGHPFITRQLCSFLSERLAERPTTIQRDFVDGLVPLYLEQRSQDFSEILDRLERDYPDELEVCRALAAHGGTAALTDLATPGRQTLALKHLIGYQIVRTTESVAALSMELLLRYLQRRLGLESVREA